MRGTLKRRLWAAALVCSAGLLFQALPGGCAQYYGQLVLNSFDFCSVFNCTGGTFFNFCQPNSIFLDCPVPTTR